MKNGLHIDKHGIKLHYLNNKLHCEDGHALEWPDGTKEWFLNDQQHRVDGPAIERSNGTKEWFLNDQLHREDGPAIEWSDGTKFWYLHDEQLEHPTEFENMEEFFQELNINEEYSLQWISDFNGIISFIKNPTNKQMRLHVMRWKI